MMEPPRQPSHLYLFFSSFSFIYLHVYIIHDMMTLIHVTISLVLLEEYANLHFKRQKFAICHLVKTHILNYQNLKSLVPIFHTIKAIADIRQLPGNLQITLTVNKAAEE
jgi:hypothetical protein